jgi:hypothetical protein
MELLTGRILSIGSTLFNLTKNTTYYWRVNAKKNGQTSAWSPTWSFTITNESAPAAPALISPVNGATGLPQDPTLTWSAVPGAASYDVQVAAEPGFWAPVVQCYAFNGTALLADNLEEGYTEHFFWRIRARNAGGLSPWSEVWEFTTSPQ